MPYLHITTRIADRKHEDLLQEKGGKGTPYMAIMDAGGNVLGKPQWPFDPQGLAATVAAVERWRKLEAAGEAGDAVAKLDAMLLGCELGQVPFDELEIDEEALSETQRRWYGQLMVDSEVESLQASLRGGRSPEQIAVLLRDLAAMHAEGSVPSTPELKHFYWQALGQKAVKEGDRATLAEAIEDLKKTPGLSEMAEAFEKQWATLPAKDEKGKKDE